MIIQKSTVASIQDEPNTAELNYFCNADFIDQTIALPNSPLAGYTPTLQTVIYAVKNILFPHLARHRIPDLLNLLTTVEFYRKNALAQAEYAIAWQEYYENDPDVVLLTPKEELAFRTMKQHDLAYREMYIRSISWSCALDIYNIWTADPPALTDFWIHFNEYFPFLNEDCDQHSPLLFQSELNDSEVDTFKRIGQESCRMVQETYAWAISHREDGQRISGLFQTARFRRRFPAPVEYEALVNLIIYYIYKVESAVTAVHNAFKPNRPTFPPQEVAF
ncbi:hypothetical protein BD779DRAFT_1670706 [Infundibulicybe gibba]|nr:hypothetical protein BD779DRAFT_1670706 [Infundibulicybe gibba]